MSNIPHGTAGGYSKHRCRCEHCRKAWRESHLRYMRAHPEQQEKNRQRTRALYERKRTSTIGPVSITL